MVTHLLTVFIYLFLLFILSLAFAIFIRETLTERWERRLDKERLKYDLLIREAFPDVMSEKENLVHKPLTPAWIAIEGELFRLLDEPGPSRSEAACGCLEGLGYVDHYIGALGGRNLWNRVDAAEKLGLLRCAKAEPYLIKALGDRAHDMRNAAITALGLIGAEGSIPHLVECLKTTVTSKETASFRRVKSALIGGFGRAALPFLEAEAGDPSWQVRAHVIDAIGEVGDADSSGVLNKALYDPDPEVRAKAAKGAGNIKDRSAVKRLIELCQDPDWVVRLHALRALGEVGSPEGIGAATKALGDPNWHIRQEAARALVRSGDGAIPALAAMARQDRDRFAREQVQEELQRSGMIFKLFDKFSSGDDEMKKEIRGLLETVCAHGVTAPLVKGLRHGDRAVVSMAADILKNAGTGKAQEALKRAME